MPGFQKPICSHFYLNNASMKSSIDIQMQEIGKIAYFWEGFSGMEAREAFQEAYIPTDLNETNIKEAIKRILDQYID